MKILHSIKYKLILITLCISLIPIFVITTVYYFNARNILKKQILRELTAIAESKKIHTLSFMKAKRERTVDFSSDGFIRDRLESISSMGQQSITVINLQRHLIKNKKTLDDHVLSIAIVDLDGKVASSTNVELIGKDVSEQEIFVKSVNNKYSNTYVDQSYYSPHLDEKCIVISAPITRRNGGDTIGVIINTYDLASLSEVTNNHAGMGESGEVYIVNRDKIMITDSRFIENATLNQMVDTEPVRRIVEGDNGGMTGIYPDYRGVSIVGASVYIPEYGWTLLAEMDQAEAFASLWNLRVIVLVAGGGCGATAIAIGIIFSLSIASPINRLKYATEKIANGNLNHKVSIVSNDEIGTLANSFNNMTLKLTQEITERKRAEGQIKASLKEKEVLLDEIHHRVKNNLQIISSLLDMSSMQTQNQETIDLFRDSRNRVESMALLHSQLYKSERFDEIDMQLHIQELSGHLLKIYSKEKTITLDIKPAKVYLPMAQALPCAIVLNELISNALKHAFRDGQQGTISISMQQLNDNLILTKVKDNGLGIPEEIDIESSNSLGLKLVRNIVYKQLNGTIKVLRNMGTEFTVEFKHSKEGS